GEFDGTGFLLVLAIVIVVMVLSAIGARRRRRANVRHPQGAQARDAATARARAARAQEIAGRALVAAEDDPAFAPDAVVAESKRLFTEIQAAWDARDEARLRAMVGDDLMVEWTRRLRDFHARGWHNRVEIQGHVLVEYVGLTNRAGTDEDRVVVRVSALAHDYVQESDGDVVFVDGLESREAAIREYWTLARRDGRWFLLSIEGDLEGEHQLRAPIVADPLDDPRLADQAMVEVAAEGRVDAARIAELAPLSFEGDALTAARDMSLVDRRFDPGVIEVSARRVVAAWTEAVDGDDAPLLAVADAAAVREMLHPGDPTGRTRLVVRRPEIRAITVLQVDPHARPATVVVRADMRGVWFVEDRDTTDVVRGDRDRPGDFRQTWTLALAETPDTPWRAVLTAAPAAA
ncbi:MAG TPA: Tim44-like domain-containing protein, partial [Miltoncostaeaceae bacterium]|nr:Tim44-like domain-containing protein [Miltoncostaeaceae bacterium]